MTTGFLNSDGVDLDTLYTAGNSGITTGFRRSDGTDLGAIMLGYVTGSQRPAYNYRRSNAVDLSATFQNSSVPTFTFSAVNESDYGYSTWNYETESGFAIGQILYYSNGTTAGYNSGALTNWANPANEGSNKYIRARHYAGSSPNGGSALNTWLLMNATRAWSLGLTTVGSDSCGLYIDFSLDGVNVAKTVTAYLSATIDW